MKENQDTIERLLAFMRLKMRKDEHGLYPPEQVDMLNDFFHSLDDVHLYHASPIDGLTELKTAQGGKSGILTDVYASVSRDFVPVFLVHNSNDKSNIDTSSGRMNYSFFNPSRIKEDNNTRGGFIYELDADPKDFYINPNSKFGIFEVTCPHSVPIKSKELCSNPIRTMSETWHFYQVDLLPYYAYGLAIGDYIEGNLSRKELGEFYSKHIATEQNKVTAATILNAPDINPGDKGHFSDETKNQIVNYHNKAIQEIRVTERIEKARRRINPEYGKTPGITTHAVFGPKTDKRKVVKQHRSFPQRQ